MIFNQKEPISHKKLERLGLTGYEEKRCIDCFPSSTIAALIENSTVGLFGFAIIHNGSRIRVQHGSDGEIYIDVGDPLPEKSESYIDFKNSVSEDEEEEIINETGEEGYEEFLQFESAWGVPNLLSKRFLGEYVETIDGGKIEFTRYERR